MTRADIRPTASLAATLLCLLLTACSSDRSHPVAAGPADTSSDAPANNDSPPAWLDEKMPQSCAEAESGPPTNAGCLFYGTMLDSSYWTDGFALAVSNIGGSTRAKVDLYIGVEANLNGDFVWERWESAYLDPLGSKQFENLPYLQLYEHYYANRKLFRHKAQVGVIEMAACEKGSSAAQVTKRTPRGFLGKGAIKIVSDAPIVAYQFNPLNGESTYSSGASVLLPVSAWGSNYHVVGPRESDAFETGYKISMTGPPVQRAYFAVVAAKDGTEVTVTPSVVPLKNTYDRDLGELLVPGTSEPFAVPLNEGDVFYVHTSQFHQSLTGTVVNSDPDHPIAVFSGHQCALIPADTINCDHVEEQLPSVNLWGRRFVASRLAPRTQSGAVDPVLWQIYASEDDTTVSLLAAESVKGLPFASRTLDAGELVEFYVYGDHSDPGDFFIDANKPIAVLQYMTSSHIQLLGEAPSDIGGDPALAYVPPIKQFLSVYIVLVPPSFAHNTLVITRVETATIYLDERVIDDEAFQPVGTSRYHVARVPVTAGVHTLRSDNDLAFGVIVAGWDDADSYAYTGGMGVRPLGDSSSID